MALFAGVWCLVGSGVVRAEDAGALPSSPVASIPHAVSGRGARAAIASASGAVRARPLSVMEAVLVGVVILMNNNRNDGTPGTFTGANGSNFAAGG